MNVSLNTVNQNVSARWDNALEALKSADSVNNVSFNAETRALVFSVNNGDTVRSVSLSMPELDVPQAADDDCQIASLCAKLGTGNLMNLSPAQVETFCKNLTNALKAYADALAAGGASGVDTSGDSKSVMFDIYALMALLVESGQKMRDAARDVRQAQNAQVQKSIQNQADMQRSAAMTGLICSVVVCAIQVGMQVVNLTYQGKGFGKQMDAQKMSGLENAKSELKMAELQCKPQDAQANLDKISQKIAPDAKNNVESTFNDSQSTKAEIGELKAKIDEFDRLQSLKDKGVQLSSEQQTAYDSLNAEILDVKTAFADKQLLLRTQVKSELADIRNNPASTPDEIAYAEAFAANEIAQNSTPQQLADDLSVARANYNQANMVMQNDARYMDGVHIENRARMFGDLITAIGSVVQGCVSSMTQMMNAEATEDSAEQQQAQEMLDQAKDLFSQCQSLIDSVVQLMQAVLQAEVQSMRDAIQA